MMTDTESLHDLLGRLIKRSADEHYAPEAELDYLAARLTRDLLAGAPDPEFTEHTRITLCHAAEWFLRKRAEVERLKAENGS